MFVVEVKSPLDVMVTRYRAALSAPTSRERKRAIEGAEALLAAELLNAQTESLPWRAGVLSPSEQAARTMAEDQLAQIRAVYSFGLIAGAARDGRLQHLLHAETICLRIWDNIRAGKKQGVFPQETGVLAELSGELRAKGIRGGRNRDTLRNYWMAYRGVAHFGAGIRVAEAEGLTPAAGIEIGEEIRFSLATESASKNKKPFVPESEQVFFRLKSIA
ncbi:hypothetical protein RXV86_12785 [Alisedimentitalea sp. MJ-SS2]|uniref:hypothetical protein n=1 Tax=Aliisedimentitalea sp. MJ-SS2 TaxID=3049795 RepID=UPI00290E9718|nr:hypothetical protein [Alisedimentitalea sp. MJ-SS2]MDU8928264.1 hypothetical protein [Alisedimentitalea sp. MJ-SS2]